VALEIARTPSHVPILFWPLICPSIDSNSALFVTVYAYMSPDPEDPYSYRWRVTYKYAVIYLSSNGLATVLQNSLVDSWGLQYMFVLAEMYLSRYRTSGVIDCNLCESMSYPWGSYLILWLICYVGDF